MFVVALRHLGQRHFFGLWLLSFQLLPWLGLSACASTGATERTRTLLPEANTLYEKLVARGKNRHALSAMGRLSYKNEGRRLRAKTVFVASRPNRFRFETLSPFEQPLQILACDGERLVVLSDDRFREGQAVPENVAKIFPLPIWPREIVDTLLGGVPISTGLVATKLSWQDDDWLLELTDERAQRWQLWIRPTSLEVYLMRLLNKDGQLYLEARFDQFSAVSGGDELPHRLRLRFEQTGQDVEIRLFDVEINAKLDPALFRLEPPPGSSWAPM